MATINKAILTVEEQFAKQVIQQARSILTKKHKNASRELYESITYEITPKGEILFYYAKEGDYVESGRRKGAKPPPIAPILKWAKIKGLAQFRDKEGKYISNESRAYSISRAIGRDGIKPLAWFSDPLEKALAKFPQIMEEAIGVVIEQQVNNVAEESTK